MILLQSAEIAKEGLKITPYTGLGYGAVVVILGFMAWYFWRAYQKANDDNLVTKEKVAAQLTEASIFITQNKGHLDDVRDEILGRLSETRQIVDKIREHQLREQNKGSGR